MTRNTDHLFLYANIEIDWKDLTLRQTANGRHIKKTPDAGTINPAQMSFSYESRKASISLHQIPRSCSPQKRVRHCGFLAILDILLMRKTTSWGAY